RRQGKEDTAKPPAPASLPKTKRADTTPLVEMAGFPGAHVIYPCCRSVHCPALLGDAEYRALARAAAARAVCIAGRPGRTGFHTRQPALAGASHHAGRCPGAR